MKQGPGEEGGSKAGERVAHALTIDLEEWFQVLNLRARCPIESWDRLELRSAEPTRRILDLCDAYGAKATFFCLGWLAERLPELVAEIARRGHEIGSHGYDHRRVDVLGEAGFRADLRRTRPILEPLAGRSIESYRACSWSVGADTPWAARVLVEEGFAFDSSILPRGTVVAADSARDLPHFVEPLPGRRLFELPPLTATVLGRRLPLGGGGWLRLFPVALVSRGLRARERAGLPSCVYLHPWELDPGQPRVGARGLARFRHYVGLAKTEAKLRLLLARHRFTTLAEVARAYEPA